MMHEIAIWYLLGTGIIVPIVVAYILSVVMRMSKQFDSVNAMLSSHERQLDALNVTNVHHYKMAKNASRDAESCQRDINLLHEVIDEHSRVDSYLASELERLKPDLKNLDKISASFSAHLDEIDEAVSEHNQAFTDFREEMDRLDSKIDDVEEEHINNMSATDDTLATHTKQINKLFAKYREISNVYEQNKDLYNEPTPPEPKAEPTIQQSIAQWRPIGNEIGSSLYVDGTLFATLTDYACVISETMQQIYQKPDMLINNKAYDWILTEGDMFGEYADQISHLINADLEGIANIEKYFNQADRSENDIYRQYNTPLSQYYLAVVKQHVPTEIFDCLVSGIYDKTIRQFFDYQGVRSAHVSAGWYVLVVEVYGANQVRTKYVPCRTRQIARRVFSIFDGFMRPAAEAYHELGYETRRKSFPVTSLRPFTDIPNLTLDTSILDKLKETFV
jgi:uncharacterized coiled-coil protein SlyX